GDVVDPSRNIVHFGNVLAEALREMPVCVLHTVTQADGSDFVILMMQVGGYKPATVTDFDIPKKYGLRQTIADTLGIGGIFSGLRTIPVL
ncbi:hypothetical protein ACC690_37745, partial [Rhizobium johnstonii]|uniref:family 4 glycosyl hydrolase n=1 Tax=Rhizobium johnstonii TaxID=3019933 RepID=UPI003F9DCD28